MLSTYNIFLFISFIYFKGYNKEFEKFAQNETDETNKDESGISLLNDATDDGDQESKGILRFSIFFLEIVYIFSSAVCLLFINSEN